MKMEQAISGTSAATYKVMEPHWKSITLRSGSTFPKDFIASCEGLIENRLFNFKWFNLETF